MDGWRSMVGYSPWGHKESDTTERVHYLPFPHCEFFKYKFIYFNWRLITLHYCVGFATHWHESATSVHVFPILSPRSHLPPHLIPQGHPSAPARSTLSHALNLDWQFVSHMIIYMFQCNVSMFNAILPNHPTLALSHRVQKTVVYICVSFAVSHTGLSLPSF